MKVVAFLFLISIAVQSCIHSEKKNEPTFKDSISLYNYRVQNHPQNSTFLQQRAQYFLDNANPDSAFIDITKAIRIDSSNADVYCLLADVYFAKANFKFCEHAITKALFLNPNHIGALTRKAEMSFYIKDYDAFFNQAKTILKLDRQNPRLYFIKAMAFKETGDTNQAVFNLQQVLKQNAEYIDAYIQIGLLYAATNQLALAEGNFKNALQLNPENTDALYALGMLYQTTNEPQKAINQYTKIIQSNPNYKYAYYNIGYINLVVLNNPKQALDFFTKTTALDSTYAEAWYNKGYCNELLRFIPQAKKDYKKAINCRPNYKNAINALNQLN